MFETAVLANVNNTKRVWSTCAGMTAQALLVLAAFLVPVIRPDVLPSAQMLVSLVAPGAPVSETPPAPAHPVTHPATTRPFPASITTYQVPSTWLPHPVQIEDAPDAAWGPCIRCVPGVPGNGANTAMDHFFPIAPPVLVRPPEITTAPPQPPAQPALVRGGDVHLGEPVYRVEPRYPAIAIAARISGMVQLEGIVGTDGHIRELRALKGNPLLVPAALEAVRLWIYEPTLLNGKPVEVLAPITVNFRLTQ